MVDSEEMKDRLLTNCMTTKRTTADQTGDPFSPFSPKVGIERGGELYAVVGPSGPPDPTVVLNVAVYAGQTYRAEAISVTVESLWRTVEQVPGEDYLTTMSRDITERGELLDDLHRNPESSVQRVLLLYRQERDGPCEQAQIRYWVDDWGTLRFDPPGDWSPLDPDVGFVAPNLQKAFHRNLWDEVRNGILRDAPPDVVDAVTDEMVDDALEQLGSASIASHGHQIILLREPWT